MPGYMCVYTQMCVFGMHRATPTRHFNWKRTSNSELQESGALNQAKVNKHATVGGVTLAPSQSLLSSFQV